MLVTFSMVIVLLGGAVGAYFFVRQVSLNSQDKAAKDDLRLNVVSAQKLANIGDVGGAENAYDSAIASTDDIYIKSGLILNKAMLYSNAGNYDKALSAANEAMGISQNSNTAQYIAQIYEHKNDSQNAIKYYQKAIDLMDNSQPLSGSDTQYYRYKIETLNGVRP